MELYLIRHGRQSSKRCNADVELAPEGFKQAALLGERLAHANITKVYSSHLTRAVQTAETANLYWQADHEIRRELMEISFGEMEGLSDEEIRKRYGSFLEQADKMEEDLPYPGGESGRDVCRRIWPVMREIISAKEEHVAIVTHGGVIRSFVSDILHMDLKNRLLLGISLENSSITRVHYSKEKERFYLSGFNDWAHLERYPELMRKNWI